MSRAAMQQALAYIEEVDYGPYDKWPVIIALKQALAEPEQPVALSDERIDFIADTVVKGMPEGISGFCKSWGWRQFARAILQDCAGHYAPTPQPEQEPVAWMQEMPVSGNEERSVRMTTVKMVADEWDNPIPLYTAPAPRKPLKEDEIADLWDGHTVPVFGKTGINPIVFARAIERAHGIGEQHE